MRLWLPLALFSVLWLDLCRQLSYVWQTNEQYAYGWFVPVLAAALFWRRWLNRPAPAVIGHWSVVSGHPLLLGLVILLLVIFLPLRVIHEINQDWSFCSYLLSGAVVGLSLYAVFLMGGWRWVRYFAFPVCFILVAVNWPYRIENSLKHRLMGAVTALTVEIIGWLNIPALQHGNVIELSTGSVGVEDACSGIRSLQSTFMAALFLGELYLLKWRWRFLLVVVGAPLAFSFNIVRTLFLTWQASSSGVAAIAKWHDSAGMTISVVCFACLWGIAWLLKARNCGNSNELPTAPPPSVGGPSSVVSSPLSAVSPYLLLVGLWSLFCLGVTEAWYRAHETDPAQTVRWSVQFPTNSPSAKEMWIDKEVRQVLRCDQGDAYSWEEQDGSNWSAYFFRWRSGEATSRMAARDHRPEICLPSSGNQLKASLGTRYLPVHGLELPFRTYTFESAGSVLYVFFCLWEDGAEMQTGLGRSKYLDRLGSVLTGKRRLGQQTLELVLGGYGSMEEAEQAVRQRLPNLILLEAVSNKLTPVPQAGGTVTANATTTFR
jgi:exosortase